MDKQALLIWLKDNRNINKEYVKMLGTETDVNKKALMVTTGKVKALDEVVKYVDALPETVNNKVIPTNKEVGIEEEHY